MRDLTMKQQRVLNYISEYTSAKNYSPSIREIQEGMMLSSPSTIKGHLDTLKRKGYITWRPGQPRTLAVIREEAHR